MKKIIGFIRIMISLFLLTKVWQFAHWSVAIILTLLAIRSEVNFILSETEVG